MLLLVVGDRTRGDEVRYPGVDLKAVMGEDGRYRFTRQDGSAYWVFIPGFDGSIFSVEWRQALWARFFTRAPPRQRRSVERYSIVKRA